MVKQEREAIPPEGYAVADLYNSSSLPTYMTIPHGGFCSINYTRNDGAAEATAGAREIAADNADVAAGNVSTTEANIAIIEAISSLEFGRQIRFRPNKPPWYSYYSRKLFYFSTTNLL